MQIQFARAGGQFELLRHVRDKLRHREAFALRLNATMFQARQFKQLLRKVAHLLPLTQRSGEILLMLLWRQRGGLERQGFQIPQQRGERCAQIVRNIGNKLPALTVAVGQLIPLRNYFACKLDKGVAQSHHFIICRGLQRLCRQLFDGANAVLLQPCDVRRQLFYRTRHPVPEQQPCQQTKERHQQQRPHRRAPERFMPRHLCQRV